MADYGAIVVGGGHNGLICAAYLARAGIKTLVLERRAIVGGACVTEEIPGAPGYRVSTGAAQLGNLPPEMAAELKLADFGYALVAPDPLTVFPFPDGRYLALWQDPARTKAEFAKFSPGDAEALPRWFADCNAFCDVIEPILDADPVPSLDEVESAFVAAGRAELFRTFMLGSMSAALDGRFESDQARAVLGYTGAFGTNAGPETPGTAYVMAHHLFGGTAGMRGRAVYVKGGMGALAEALSRAAAHFGAELRTGAEVARILVRDGTAHAVELAGGEVIRADAIISNADPHRTFLRMIDGNALSTGFRTSLSRVEMQGVAMKVNCALDALPRFSAAPEGEIWPRVSLCPSPGYVEAAWADARAGRPSQHPIMTVHMQSAVDGSLAPEGRHSLTCYAQYFPYFLDPSLGGWDAHREAAGEIILDTVAAYAPDLRDRILATEVMTPLDIERRFAMTGGHQFHGDLMPGQILDARPVPGCSGARTPLDRLYLCGAGAHPGGCVWGVPGRRAARAVIADRD